MQRPVSVAVLAGGRARRMGQDKRWVEVAGQPLLARALRSAALAGDDLVVVTSSEADRRHARDATLPPARWLVDLRPGEGPLAGIETALAHAAHDVVLVVAGDHPLVAPAVLELLVARLHEDPGADAVMLATDRGPQPLVAAYRRSALATVRQVLDAGERRATALPSELDTIVVPPDEWRALDPDGHTSIDVDTPSDLAGLPGGLGRGAVGASTTIGRAAPVRVVPLRGDDGPRDDLVAVEEPLELRIAGPGQEPVTVATTLRTPGHDEELAVGWLHCEGLLGPGEVDHVRVGDPAELAVPDDQLTVHVTRPVELGLVAHRHAVATASCGVCGRATIDELADRCAVVPADAPPGGPVEAAVLAALPERARAAQTVFDATGGLHAAALFRPDGTLVTLREDVGRHNALDAAIGAHVLAGEVPLHGLIGILSGRLGFELVAKAAAAGLPVLAGVGAPTDLAVRTADRLGVTLVGFLREGRGNVYTHTHRVRPAAPAPSAARAHREGRDLAPRWAPASTDRRSPAVEPADEEGAQDGDDRGDR